MPIVECQCGNRFQAMDADAGRRILCPRCGSELIVPKPGGGDFDDPTLMGDYATRTSGKAIASLVLGISSFVCLFFTGLPAIIFGSIGLSDIGKSKGRLGGKGMAIGGIVLGCVGSFLSLFALMAALLLPAVQAARGAAQRAQCTNNLKQIALAMHNFESANGSFPAPAIADATGKPLLSWRVAILPYIGEDALYKEFKLDEPWDSPSNMALLDRVPSVYVCPSGDPNTRNETPYQVVVGPKSMFEGPKGTSLRTVTDGTSNTLLTIEARTPVPWTKPEDVDIADLTTAIGSRHPGGANVSMGDGSVRFLKSTMNPVILKALGTRNGNEVIGPGAF